MSHIFSGVVWSKDVNSRTITISKAIPGIPVEQKEVAPYRNDPLEFNVHAWISFRHSLRVMACLPAPDSDCGDCAGNRHHAHASRPLLLAYQAVAFEKVERALRESSAKDTRSRPRNSKLTVATCLGGQRTPVTGSAPKLRRVPATVSAMIGGCSRPAHTHHERFILDLAAEGAKKWPLRPGDTAAVPVQFLRPDVVLPLPPVSGEFKLREARYIGERRVVCACGQTEQSQFSYSCPLTKRLRSPQMRVLSAVFSSAVLGII
jgi:hypothetical protein